MRKIFFYLTLALSLFVTAEENPVNYRVTSSNEAAALNQYAEKTVSIFKAGPKPDFGYDEPSVKFLSDTLSKERASYSQKAKEALPDIFGSYLGAALIKQYGGAWVYVEGMGYAVLFEESRFVFPMNRVSKHIKTGDQVSIYSLYVAIPELLKGIEGN